MKFLVLFVVLFFCNLSITSAQDKYVLPKDIIIARDKLLATKRKLDNDILHAYAKLCQAKKINEAEYIEFLAYQEITGVDCRGLFIQGI